MLPRFYAIPLKSPGIVVVGDPVEVVHVGVAALLGADPTAYILGVHHELFIDFSDFELLAADRFDLRQLGSIRGSNGSL